MTALTVGQAVYLRDTTGGLREKATGPILYLITELRGSNVYVRREDNNTSQSKGLRVVAARSMVVPA